MLCEFFSLTRSALLLGAIVLLSACGGGGSASEGSATTSPVPTPAPVTAAFKLAPPVLSFNDTGLDVTDGITRNGVWDVESDMVWEFSLDQGANWTRGTGSSFEVKGDGAKIIWVRTRDNDGNTSEIVRVNCVLDTMAPSAVMVTSQLEGVTNTLKLSGIEPGARWEYALDQKGPWSPGTGAGLGTLGNGLATVWLRQVDVAGNASDAQAFDLKNQTMFAHEASGNPLQPSLLAQGMQTYLIHGVVVRGDADYVRWDIPKGQRLVSVKLVQYISEDAIAFYALQASKVFDAGVDTARMLVYGHMGPADLSRNLVATLASAQLGEGAMTLWFQQTGPLNTQYAIEVVMSPVN